MAGKQGSASRRSLTRQHKVSSHKNTAVTKSQRRLRYSFLCPTKCGPFPFITEPSVDPLSRISLRTFRSMERCTHFYILHFPSVLFSPYLFPHIPFRKPGYFLCKVRLPAVSPVKYHLRLPLENLPLRHIGSVFSVSSLPGPATNPPGRKIISLRYRNVSEGKQKN